MRSILVGAIMLAGAITVWIATGRWGPAEPRGARLGAMALYVAGCIAYVELLSLLSRGYSLRVLADLLGRNGRATLDELKASYSNGRGLSGMLARRVSTLARLGLIHRHGDAVGPLTARGRLVAAVADGLRRSLKLERVG